MSAPIDLFGDRFCRLCAHWSGSIEHAAQQAPALCRDRTRLHPYPRTYADDTCASFVDAGRKAA